MDLELESQRGEPLTKEDLRREFERARLGIHSVFAEFNVGTTQKGSKMEQGISAFEGEMRNRFCALELQIQKCHAATAWMILISTVVVVGALSVLLGLLFLFTNHLGK